MALKRISKVRSDRTRWKRKNASNAWRWPLEQFLPISPARISPHSVIPQEELMLCRFPVVTRPNTVDVDYIERVTELYLMYKLNNGGSVSFSGFTKSCREVLSAVCSFRQVNLPDAGKLTWDTSQLLLPASTAAALF